MTFVPKNKQRILGFLLVCVQAMALGYLTQIVFFPVGVCAAALFAILTNVRFSPSQRAAFWMTAGLTLFFIAKYRIAPVDLDVNQRFFLTELAHAIAQLLLAVQVAQFFLKKYDERLPAGLPGFGGIVLICAADVRIASQQRTTFQLLVVGFAVLSALYFSACRKPAARLPHAYNRGRTVASGAVLIVIVLAAWFSANALYHNERRIEGWIAEILAPSFQTGSVGFTGKGHLGNVAWQKSVLSNQIALRAYAQHAPGYLRGMAFEQYSGGDWSVSPLRDELKPINELPHGMTPTEAGQRLFSLAQATSSHWQEVEVWPNARLEEKCFTPLGTTHLKANSDEVTVNAHAILETDGQFPAHPYTALIPTGGTFKPLTRSIGSRLTKLPAELDPRVQGLADHVFGGCSTTHEKIKAVERYFHNHFRYSLGMAAPAGEDPLTYFLLQKPDAQGLPAGHCEYFASGAAMLLRLSGVACRYVTGFVATERNDYGDYWVARNKDAHAWVEAFDPQRGWTIVEATPTQGVPAPSPPSQASQFGEYLRDRIHMLRVALQQGVLRSIATACLSLLTSVPGLALAFAAILMTALYLRRKLRKPRTIPQDPVLQRLHRLLNQMDARLSKQNLRRRHSETLHQFAGRVSSRSIADWYRRYAAVRYAQPKHESVFELEQAIRSI